MPAAASPLPMTKADIVRAYQAALLRTQRLDDVKLPRLFDARGRYTVTGLSFVYFFARLRQIVGKHELLCFLRRHGCCRHTMPHPRHFGMQSGFYFLVQGCYHAVKRRVLSAGEYCLYSVARGHPSLGAVGARERRRTLDRPAFDRLKRRYCGRCSVCGSPEAAQNFKNPALVTKLEMGHCDPRKPLAGANCIPMCQYCNRVYRDKWVFNRRGIVLRAVRP